MCNDKIIKELLPAYGEQALDRTEVLMIESHLASCDDCRSELSLLRMMAEETVPDPGEAFWAAMPDRVYQTVQKHQTKRKTFDLAWLLDRTAFPRWTWAAATLGIVLIVAWFIVTPPQKKTEIPQPQGDEFADATSAAGSVSVADLDLDELSTIDSWAGSELASIAREAEPVLVYGRDVDIYEEIEDLNAGEVERLSTMLAQIGREG
jgi:anti-sigma factor RsiW